MPSAACCAAARAISRSSRRCWRLRTGSDPLRVDPMARRRVDARVGAGSDPARAVGARLPRVDGWAKVAGTDKFGADEAPADALWMRVVRSPHARARFTLGDLDAVKARNPGLAAILTAADVPGENAFGIFPDMKDQPVLAPGHVRFRGEAVLALVGTRAAVESISRRRAADRMDAGDAAVGHRGGAGTGRSRAFMPACPTTCWRAAICKCGDVAGGARARGRDRRGALRDRLRRARLYRAGGRLRRARRRRAGSHRGDGLHPGALHGPARRRRACWASTRSRVRIRPTRLRRRLRRQARRVGAAAAGGGGVGDEAAGAHRLHAHRVHGLDHQAPSRAHLGARRRPTRRAASPPSRCEADFNTGAYASWGPTVANRVPVHGMGPYRVPNAAAAHARRLHQRDAGRRLPRLRRAAGGDRARDADGRSRRAAGPRPLGHPPHQCARPRRHHAVGPGARRTRPACPSASTP